MGMGDRKEFWPCKTYRQIDKAMKKKKKIEDQKENSNSAIWWKMHSKTAQPCLEKYFCSIWDSHFKEAEEF